MLQKNEMIKLLFQILIISIFFFFSINSIIVFFILLNSQKGRSAVLC